MLKRVEYPELGLGIERYNVNVFGNRLDLQKIVLNGIFAVPQK